MDMYREQRIHELRTLIERGDYVVDPTGTADAVVRCVSGLALARADAQAPPPVRHDRRRIRGGVRVAARHCRGMKTALVAAVR